MTPSQKPVSARSASAQWTEDTAPSAAVSAAVTNAEKSMVARNPDVSPSRQWRTSADKLRMKSFKVLTAQA